MLLKPGVFAALLSLASVASVHGQIGFKTTEQYNNSLTLDPAGDYVLHWNFNATHVTFEVHVKTRGYVGFGLSHNGNMYPADVVVGWVNNGTVYFKDRHTTAKSAPIIDKSQDWFLVHGEENDIGTLIKFVRKIDTCDSEDIAINDGTQRIIYSYHPDDPVDENSLIYHGAERRGTKSVSLLRSSRAPVSYGNDEIKTVDIFANNYIIPEKDTTYLCIGFQMPDIGAKHHMIMYEPIYTPGNEHLLHHLTIQRCIGKHPELHGKREECLGIQPPGFPQCPEMFLAWATGGGPFYFPENTGYSVGAQDDLSFYMLQIHYDNPGLKKGVIDNSGIRLHLTSTLRQHDVSSIIMGTLPSPVTVLPPGEPAYINSGHCSAKCLGSAFERANLTEVKFIAAFQHAHLLAKGIRTRHFRNDTELKPLQDDPNYDFYFQEFRPIIPEVTVKKGDRFITECTYDTTKRTNTSFGGYSTREEMCETIVYHYPKLPIMVCESVPLMESWYGKWPINTPDKVAAYRNYVDNYFDWDDPSVKHNFKTMMANISYNHICYGTEYANSSQWGNYSIFKENDHSFTPYVVPKSTCL